MDNLPMTGEQIKEIALQFGIIYEKVTGFCNTSHGDQDIRWNFMLDNRYVLKINSRRSMWEARLQEISRLIGRYQSIGLYCPGLIPALSGALSCQYSVMGQAHTCFMEEFAPYPLYEWEAELDRTVLVEHLGMLASRYTGVDLSATRSMWSIIDLAPLDTDVDEKQENADMLIKTLNEQGYHALAEQLNMLNQDLRTRIKADFDLLPRCVYQGDLNTSNMLHDDENHFVGLIDFNCSGTDVNINVFANETAWFPEPEDFDRMTVARILSKMDAEQAQNMRPILKHYTLNELETQLLPYYRRIVELFQYPNVCSVVKWLKDNTRREKAAELIQSLVTKELRP